MFEQPIREARVILDCRKRRASIKEENFEDTLLYSAVVFFRSPLCFFPRKTGLDDINAHRSQFSIRIIDKEGA